MKIGVIRGSTTRGGSTALLGLIRRTGGTHVVLTPDGPVGPRRRLKPGAVALAGMTGMPIVPIGVACPTGLAGRELGPDDGPAAVGDGVLRHRPGDPGAGRAGPGPAELVLPADGSGVGSRDDRRRTLGGRRPAADPGPANGGLCLTREETAMDRNQLRSTLAELLEKETGTALPKLEDDADLKESLGLDSVDLIGLVLQVENRFGVRVETEELMTVRTVGGLLDLLGSKVPATPSAAA